MKAFAIFTRTGNYRELDIIETSIESAKRHKKDLIDNYDYESKEVLIREFPNEASVYDYCNSIGMIA